VLDGNVRHGIRSDAADHQGKFVEYAYEAVRSVD
jgi:hypothetical protein